MYVKLENEKVASVPRTSSLSVKGELTFDPSTQMLMLSLVLLLPVPFSPSFILTLSSFPFLPLSFPPSPPSLLPLSSILLFLKICALSAALDPLIPTIPLSLTVLQ